MILAAPLTSRMPHCRQRGFSDGAMPRGFRRDFAHTTIYSECGCRRTATSPPSLLACIVSEATSRAVTIGYFAGLRQTTENRQRRAGMHTHRRADTPIRSLFFGLRSVDTASMQLPVVHRKKCLT
jgi:hypothetical protein